jgi:predicted DNA-binding protein with PD1-like motif
MRRPHFAIGLPHLLIAFMLPSCAESRAPTAHDPVVPVVRWVTPAETAPHGRAPGARHRVLATQTDGTKVFVLVLSKGDEVLTALTDFARGENVVNAHFVAIGAVRDPEVGFFDTTRREYKAISLDEQMEVLTLAGDIAVAESGQPVVHAHLVLGRGDGSAWGGHLLRATVSPTLVLYFTSYPQHLYKRLEPDTQLQLIDPVLIR